MKLAKINGVDLSSIYEGTISIHFGNLNPEAIKGDKKGRVIARAHGSDNDNQVHVEVDRVVWNSMSELHRTATMYHELSHDILNAAHVNEIDGHLMGTHNKFRTIAELVEAMAMLFEEHKAGTLRIFDENTKY